MSQKPVKFLRNLRLTSTLASVAFLGLTLTSCYQPSSLSKNSTPQSNSPDTEKQVASPINQQIWLDQFAKSEWQQNWQIRDRGSWGLENAEVIQAPGGKFDQSLRVFYPAGSASPAVSRKHDAPLGGTQFYAELGVPASDALRLSYYLRFSDSFNFVKGGKLPGLFGGTGGSGGKIPDGTDGFSTRFMWRKNGDGEVYAYLPSSAEHGTSIGRGNWQFTPGKWHHLEQELILNEPGRADGQIRVWLDDKLVLNREGITFRTVDSLKIDGIFFSTFFGGGDPSWATPKDVYIDFASFSILEAE